MKPLRVRGSVSFRFTSLSVGLALGLLALSGQDIIAQRPGQLSRRVAADAGSADAPLLFCVGVHIEPFGAEPSAIVGNAPRPPFASPRRPDYNNRPFFEKHVEDLRLLVALVEKHGGKLTVQAQTPFTRVAAESGVTLFADLEKRGHEVALHFHEDAHLGRGCDALPVEKWAAVMKEEVDWLKKAGATRVRYWSGGNLYSGVLEAAARAGLDVMSDHKNPRQQKTDEKLLAVVPWRPSGGPRENDVTAFAKHDPAGKIVYLPDGIFGRVDFNSMRRAMGPGGDYAYFDSLTDGLERSLRAARKDRVNVFHITVHAGEFRGGPFGQPFAVIDRWLTEIVDPLVKAGKIRWATFSEMADAYRKWEKEHPGVDPRSVTQTVSLRHQGQTDSLPHGYVTFVLNVHDTRYVNESADTVLRLIKIFQKYKVRGDFYLTAPKTEMFVKQRPDVIAALQESGMTISYHVRPPHPIYAGFDARLRNLDDEKLAAAVRDYEIYHLDLTTGDLQRDQPGGYAYVAKVFGRPPVVVSPQSGDPRIRAAALKVYADLGARMAVLYHESGTKLKQPFEWSHGLLARPSDFSVTRWALPGEPRESFWWNRLDSPQAAAFNPTAYLKKRLTEWSGSRPPFITALIHENNFYRFGPEAWQFVYTDPQTRRPLSPPYDLNAPDRSRPRSSEEQERIWKAYEELVAHAAAHLRVVTSEDIVAMAEKNVH